MKRNQQKTVVQAKKKPRANRLVKSGARSIGRGGSGSRSSGDRKAWRSDSSDLKSDEVTQAIRDAITIGRFRQGDLLSEAVLQEYMENERKMSVSRMPIRRAIAHLEAQGILTVVPKKGTAIRVPEDWELKEIWDTRVAFEEFMIVRLARKRDRNLSKVQAAQREMEKIAGTDEFAIPTAKEQVKFVIWDERFHEELAHAAGYPSLAEELRSLRFKLQLAAPLSSFATKQRMLEIVNEHGDILHALDGNAAHKGTRPDINTVRLAFLVHMRNSGRYGWKIEQRIKPAYASEAYSQNYVFDVPDLPPKACPMKDTPIWKLLTMRLSVELCAVWQLASRPGTDLSMIQSLNQEMWRLASQLSDEDLRTEKASRFMNLDMSFHSAISFCSGLLFGEEVITYVWHRLRDLAKYDLDRDRVQSILREHQQIVDALTESRGEKAHVEKAVDALEVHLLGAAIRNNFDHEMLAQAIEEGREQIIQIGEMVKKDEMRLDELRRIADEPENVLQITKS